MPDSALSVRYRRFRYQAQSDIADHGYRTKCPPMCFNSFRRKMWFVHIHGATTTIIWWQKAHPHPGQPSANSFPMFPAGDQFLWSTAATASSYWPILATVIPLTINLNW
jgi:hypothetical protein